jgi:para-aminobenzoate synthetase component 1
MGSEGVRPGPTGRQLPPAQPPPGDPAAEARAWFRGWSARGVAAYEDLRRTPEALAEGGWWAVVAEFEGPVHAWRFAEARRVPEGRAPAPERAWSGPPADAWTSSMSRAEYCAAVEAVREAVREGEVYQANICRVLHAPLPGDGGEPAATALAAVLAAGNPAPYAGGMHVPGPPTARPPDGAVPAVLPVWVVSASPELSLAVADGWVTSRPIKGTGRTTADLTEKDRAENLMITDLVRNDLQRVCAPGSVEVTALLQVEEHPGLVHLVSTVRGRLLTTEPSTLWRGLLAAALPAGSVSGAPKSSALRLIAALEPEPRGPYCGAIGWIDADNGQAELAVGIRTFWWRDGVLSFGTGAGITWGSDAAAEWAETELKASRLIALASAGPGAA